MQRRWRRRSRAEELDGAGEGGSAKDTEQGSKGYRACLRLREYEPPKPKEEAKEAEAGPCSM